MDSPTDRPPNDTAETDSPLPLDPVQSQLSDTDDLEVLELDATVPDPDENQRDNTLTVGEYRLPNLGRAVLWSLLLLGPQLIVGVVVGVIIAVFVLPTGRLNHLDPKSQMAELQVMINHYVLPIATLVTLLTSLGIVVVAFRKQMARCMGLRGLTATQAGLVLLSALPLSLLTSELTNCAAHLFPNLSLDLFGEFSRESWVLVFLAACFFPGFGEELFFRGFLSRGLIAHHGVLKGTLFASFLFGAIHLHPVQACGAFALGLALQFIFLATRSLWGAVLLHTANNTLAFAAMKYGQHFPIPGFTAASAGAIEHTPLPLVVAAAATVAALLVALHRTRTQWLLPNGSEWSRGFVSSEGPRPEVTVQKVSRALDVRIAGVLLLTYAAFLAALWRYIDA